MILKDLPPTQRYVRTCAVDRSANGSASVQQLYQKRSHHLLLRVGGRDSLQDCARSSESELPSTVNGGSKVLNVAYHHGNGEMLHALCGWNGSTATSFFAASICCCRLSVGHRSGLPFLLVWDSSSTTWRRSSWKLWGIHGREGTLSICHSDALAWVTPISRRVARRVF